ncbi:hypothetical protein NHX12_030848, partial [Muraenolepis orangiensis]
MEFGIYRKDDRLLFVLALVRRLGSCRGVKPSHYVMLRRRVLGKGSAVPYFVMSRIGITYHCETDQSTDGEEEAPEEEAPEEDTPGEEAPEEDTPGEEAPEEEAPEVTFQSNEGNLLWYSSTQDRGGRARVDNIIRMTPGPTRYATSRVDDIKSSFQLFLPESIVEIILEITNLEGRRVFADTWKALDQIAYKPTWNYTTFPLARLQTGCHQKRDRWVEHLPLMYNPAPEVTVDERLVTFRGRCPFKQYIPSKPGKYGIKIWAACDARSSYAWNMQVYTANLLLEGQEKKRVVLDMIAGLKGHNITCDNFFTSHGLVQELLKRKLTMMGTVRKNNPQLPPALVSTRGREALSSKLVSYLPKKNKNVILMSRLHKDAAVSTAEHRKPHIILDYNRNKGDIDCLDKLTGTYTCKPMTARWPVAVFHNILDVSACNAYVVWTAIVPAWNQGKHFKRRLFLAELGKVLVTPLIQRRQHLPRAPASASLPKGLAFGEMDSLTGFRGYKERLS